MKIMHISDLHFGMHQKDIIPYFLDDCTTFNPELVIISGDITQRATHSQYQLFTDFLKCIPATVLVVPGNHDISLYNVFSRLSSPFARYKSYVTPDLIAQAKNDSVRILGVNSVNPYRAKNGKLSSSTMEEISNYFHTPFNGLNILFFHHNFDYLEGLHKPLENYTQFLNYLKDSSIDIVCTGHSHYAHISFIEKNNQYPCALLHAGTLLCQRSKDYLNSYYQIEINEKVCTIHLRVFKERFFQTLTTHTIDFAKKACLLKK